MKKRNITMLAKCLTVAIIVTGVGANAKTVTMATEMAMAGISVSLEKFSNKEANVDSKEEVTTKSDSKVDSASTSSAVSSSAVEDKKSGSSDSASKEKTTKKTSSTPKLNLVYDRLGMANVDTYLNVRKGPKTSSKIVGKMTKNSGCNIYTINKKGWAKIVSGGVTGWVKAKFLLKDKAAEKKAYKVATLRANVTTETLNVRFLPSTDSKIYDQISQKDDYTIEVKNITKSWLKRFVKKHTNKKRRQGIEMSDMYKNCSDWMCISIDNEKAFVNKDFVKVTYNVDRAVSISLNSHKGGSSDDSSSDSSSSGTLSSIVNYAMQFLGNRYVWGGTSLTNGTDCSGFTMSIYAHFGYSIPRTSSSQAASLRTVSSSEARPGDLFFYGYGGSVSHVALYIGNGQIIHASNSRTGIIISSAYYRSPIKIGRVIG